MTLLLVYQLCHVFTRAFSWDYLVFFFGERNGSDSENLLRCRSLDPLRRWLFGIVFSSFRMIKRINECFNKEIGCVFVMKR